MSSSCFLRYLLFLGQRGPSKVCQVGTHWRQNLIPHPTSSPDRNLSKSTGRYLENTNKKVVFSFLSPKLIILFYYFNYYFINFPQEAHFELKFPLIQLAYFLHLQPIGQCVILFIGSAACWLSCRFVVDSLDVTRCYSLVLKLAFWTVCHYLSSLLFHIRLQLDF